MQESPLTYAYWTKNLKTHKNWGLFPLGGGTMGYSDNLFYSGTVVWDKPLLHCTVHCYCTNWRVFQLFWQRQPPSESANQGNLHVNPVEISIEDDCQLSERFNKKEFESVGWRSEGTYLVSCSDLVTTHGKKLGFTHTLRFLRATLDVESQLLLPWFKDSSKRRPFIQWHPSSA